MKLKNIPEDIREKSIKEAQDEIKEIIATLEGAEANLEESVEKYNRMLQLNHYIQEKFKKKLSEIKKTTLSKDQKTSFKD